MLRQVNRVWIHPSALTLTNVISRFNMRRKELWARSVIKSTASRLVASHLRILLLPVQNVNLIEAFKSHYRVLISTVSRRSMAKAQIPLYRLPRDVRDKPVTSPLVQIPLRSRNFPGRESFGEVGVMEFGLNVFRWHDLPFSDSDSPVVGPRNVTMAGRKNNERQTTRFRGHGHHQQQQQQQRDKESEWRRMPLKETDGRL